MNTPNTRRFRIGSHGFNRAGPHGFVASGVASRRRPAAQASRQRSADRKQSKENEAKGFHPCIIFLLLSLLKDYWNRPSTGVRADSWCDSNSLGDFTVKSRRYIQKGAPHLRRHLPCSWRLCSERGRCSGGRCRRPSISAYSTQVGEAQATALQHSGTSDEIPHVPHSTTCKLRGLRPRHRVESRR